VDVRGLLRRSAALNRDRLAVKADGRELTFDEMWKRGVRLANGLLELGLRPQDRLATLEANGLGAADTFVGAAAANLVRVPLYERNARHAHVAMLNNVGARALIVDRAYLDEVDGIAAGVPTLEYVIVRDDTYETWLAACSDVDPDPPVAEDDLYIVRHTGGTTGAPKPVPNSHRTWIACARDYFYPLPAPALGDIILHAGPLSHASGYWLLPLWAVGGVQVLASGLTPEQLIDTLEREQVAYSFVPPVMMARLGRVPGAAERDWSKAKAFLMSGGPVTEQTVARARSIFGDHALYQLYGQTETGAVAIMGPEEWFADVPGSEPLRSCGRVHPWVELEIRDDDGRALAPGSTGEIAVRCDGQFHGFYDAPGETVERLLDGWVLTGDVGRLDANGYLYLVDRKHDTIVSGGFNVYPGELESAIGAHPAVIEVAVFGIPHEQWGETPMAVCTVDPGLPVTEDEIVQCVVDRLGSYMKPTRVELTLERLPRSPTGKVLRRALREPHWSGSESRVAGA
jgi:acyl-CoA synthetase (AMP-forming)/AMP-acid ligase II